jgi:short subunit fatty acids transporter
MTRKNASEADSIYFLKILLYFVLGTIWVQWHGRTILPIGLILGLVFAHKEHFRIDRKMEYAILVIAAFLGLLGLGLFINLAQ